MNLSGNRNSALVWIRSRWIGWQSRMWTDSILIQRIPIREIRRLLLLRESSTFT